MRFKVLLGMLLCVLMAGCSFTDSIFLNSETKTALAEMEETREELKQAKAAVELAKTDEEKAVTAAALLKVVDRADAAQADLDEALESGAPSPIESLAGLASAFGLPWLVTLAAGGAATYKHVRAKNGDKARDAVLETVEDLGDTEEGQKVKKKLAAKFEQKGVTPYVDAGLRILGFLRKKKPEA